MSVPVTRPMDQHKQVGFLQSPIMRSASPWFAPPVPVGMREPGTNYVTLITAPDPHNTETPGTGGGIMVHNGDNSIRKQSAVRPLTHKGG
jgi:hypothetical protein